MSSKENKLKLLEMARNGEPKPFPGKHPLGYVFNNYINKNCRSYDERFDREIRSIAPHWFIKTAAENKKKLLQMARNGESRPVQKKHLLGDYLNRYTAQSSHSFDEQFKEQIKKIAPHWFVDTAAENKKQLLLMAKSGEQRPIAHKQPLGRAICNYTNKSGSYDPQFDEKIRMIAPHWFVNVTTENKKKLLEMARNGEPRPVQVKHPLGNALSNYIKGGSSYDPQFDEKIRMIAPHWFKK